MAAESFRAVIAIQPDDAFAWIRLGNALIDMTQYPEAENAFRSALELDGQSASAWFGLGQVASKTDRPDEAVRCFEKALQLQPQASSIHYPLALAYRKAGNIDRARELMAQKGKGKIQLPDPHLRDLNDMITTTSVRVTLALAADMASFSSASYEAFVVAQLTSRDGIAEFLERVAEQTENEVERARILYAVGVIHEKRGKPAVAMAFYRRATSANPAFPEPCLRLADALIARGESGEAVSILDRLIQSAENHVRARFVRSAALMNLGTSAHLEKAIVDLEAVVESVPDDAEYSERLAIAYGLAGRTEAAAERYRTTLTLQPSNEIQLRCHRALARHYQQNKQLERAVEQLERAVELAPDDSDLGYWLGSVMGLGGEYQRAADQMQRVIQLDPYHADARLGQVVSLILDGHQPLEELEAALKVMPDHGMLRVILARILAASPQPELRDGSRALRIAEELVAEDASALHRETYAMALAQVGRFEKAAQVQRELGDRERVLENLNRYERGEPCCEQYSPAVFLGR